MPPVRMASPDTAASLVFASTSAPTQSQQTGMNESSSVTREPQHSMPSASPPQQSCLNPLSRMHKFQRTLATCHDTAAAFAACLAHIEELQVAFEASLACAHTLAHVPSPVLLCEDSMLPPVSGIQHMLHAHALPSEAPTQQQTVQHTQTHQSHHHMEAAPTKHNRGTHIPAAYTSLLSPAAPSSHRAMEPEHLTSRIFFPIVDPLRIWLLALESAEERVRQLKNRRLSYEARLEAELRDPTSGSSSAAGTVAAPLRGQAPHVPVPVAAHHTSGAGTSGRRVVTTAANNPRLPSQWWKMTGYASDTDSAGREEQQTGAAREQQGHRQRAGDVRSLPPGLQVSGAAGSSANSAAGSSTDTGAAAGSLTDTGAEASNSAGARAGDAATEQQTQVPRATQLRLYAIAEYQHDERLLLEHIKWLCEQAPRLQACASAAIRDLSVVAQSIAEQASTGPVSASLLHHLGFHPPVPLLPFPLHCLGNDAKAGPNSTLRGAAAAAEALSPASHSTDPGSSTASLTAVPQPSLPSASHAAQAPDISTHDDTPPSPPPSPKHTQATPALSHPSVPYAAPVIQTDSSTADQAATRGLVMDGPTAAFHSDWLLHTLGLETGTLQLMPVTPSPSRTYAPPHQQQPSPSHNHPRAASVPLPIPPSPSSTSGRGHVHHGNPRKAAKAKGRATGRAELEGFSARRGSEAWKIESEVNASQQHPHSEEEEIGQASGEVDDGVEQGAQQERKGRPQFIGTYGGVGCLFKGEAGSSSDSDSSSESTSSSYRGSVRDAEQQQQQAPPNTPSTPIVPPSHVAMLHSHLKSRPVIARRPSHLTILQDQPLRRAHSQPETSLATSPTLTPAVIAAARFQSTGDEGQPQPPTADGRVMASCFSGNWSQQGNRGSGDSKRSSPVTQAVTTAVLSPCSGIRIDPLTGRSGYTSPDPSLISSSSTKSVTRTSSSEAAGGQSKSALATAQQQNQSVRQGSLAATAVVEEEEEGSIKRRSEESGKSEECWQKQWCKEQSHWEQMREVEEIAQQKVMQDQAQQQQQQQERVLDACTALPDCQPMPFESSHEFDPPIATPQEFQFTPASSHPFLPQQQQVGSTVSAAEQEPPLFESPHAFDPPLTNVPLPPSAPTPPAPSPPPPILFDAPPTCNTPESFSVSTSSGDSSHDSSQQEQQQAAQEQQQHQQQQFQTLTQLGPLMTALLREVSQQPTSEPTHPPAAATPSEQGSQDRAERVPPLSSLSDSLDQDAAHAHELAVEAVTGGSQALKGLMNPNEAATAGGLPATLAAECSSPRSSCVAASQGTDTQEQQHGQKQKHQQQEQQQQHTPNLTQGAHTSNTGTSTAAAVFLAADFCTLDLAPHTTQREQRLQIEQARSQCEGQQARSQCDEVQQGEEVSAETPALAPVSAPSSPHKAALPLLTPAMSSGDVETAQAPASAPTSPLSNIVYSQQHLPSTPHKQQRGPLGAVVNVLRGIGSRLKPRGARSASPLPQIRSLGSSPATSPQQRTAASSTVWQAKNRRSSGALSSASGSASSLSSATSRGRLVVQRKAKKAGE